MEMIGIINFCKKHALAEKLMLNQSIVLKTILDEIHMQLDSDVSPHEAAHSALTVLDIAAQNAHSEDNTQIESVTPLAKELAAIIADMLANEVPPIALKDATILERFFKDHKIAETLNIPSESGLESFLAEIHSGLLRAYSPQRIAADTLRFMEDIAASHAAETKTYDYELIGNMENQLTEAIQKAIS